jgi:hypothetical protein
MFARSCYLAAKNLFIHSHFPNSTLVILAHDIQPGIIVPLSYPSGRNSGLARSNILMRILPFSTEIHLPEAAAHNARASMSIDEEEPRSQRGHHEKRQTWVESELRDKIMPTVCFVETGHFIID